MIRFRCPQCDQLLESPAGTVGQLVRCPCGHEMKVPLVAGAIGKSSTPSANPPASIPTTDAASSVPNTETPTRDLNPPQGVRTANNAGPAASPSPQAAPLFVRCPCGTQLKTTQEAIGKAVRCPCGQLVSVTDSAISASGPATNIEQSSGDLNIPAYIQPAKIRDRSGGRAAPARPDSSGTASAHQDSSAWREKASYPAAPSEQMRPAPRSSASGSVYAPSGSPETSAQLYLQQAEKELNDRDRWNRQDAGASINGIGILLITIGLLSIAVNGFYYAQIDDEVAAVIEKQPELAEQRDQLASLGAVIYGVSIGFGCMFIFLGVAAYFFPFGAPLTALVVYVLVTIIALIVNPIAVLKPGSLIAKLLITGALIKAVNSGAYYAHNR